MGGGAVRKLLLLILALVATAAHAARAAPGTGANGDAVTRAARSLLSRASCCTHDGNTTLTPNNPDYNNPKLNQTRP
uniref:Uncharacterized protein n=2 Tax=Oryza sativa subsp. japonica TaxID=39947 RepID=Q8W336_ORYSJ|nr:hypothetical protein [Oryza sativa Japonica Group]ABF98550.1 hypothetical protein LOC_Os03g50720 [Oryza sativa Japonica Group]